MEINELKIAAENIYMDKFANNIKIRSCLELLKETAICFNIDIDIDIEFRIAVKTALGSSRNSEDVIFEYLRGRIQHFNDAENLILKYKNLHITDPFTPRNRKERRHGRAN